MPADHMIIIAGISQQSLQSDTSVYYQLSAPALSFQHAGNNNIVP